MQRKKTFRNLICFSIAVSISVVVVMAGCSSQKRKETLSDRGGSQKGDGMQVKVMSFNIAGDVDDDEDFKEWQRRKVLIADIIQQQRPDVVGLQEAFIIPYRPLEDR
jgi:mRNA deadenylase 3'-5' endonuclease subunit Ccr4